MMLILNCSNIISYAENGNENNEVSELFKDFITEAYNNIDNLHVVNKDGENVTDYFINKTKDLFDRKDYKAIQKIVVNEKLTLFIDTISNSGNNKLMSVGRVQYCYDIITHKYNLQGHTQTWDVILEGVIVYDPNTGEIYSASSPSLDLYDTSGINSQLSPYFKSVSTNYTIMTSKVKFYATYTMEARLNGKIDGVDILPPAIITFGTYNAQFYAYPE